MSRNEKFKIARPRAKAPALWLFAASACCASAILAGCRKPGAQAPLAPQMRGPVTDLAAIRAADEISLVWTVPKKGTGKLAVNGSIEVQVCRRENTTGACIDAGKPQSLRRGAPGSFSERLPASLASGSPRLLYYFVELMDRRGRSTGLSNSVVTLAGAPPPPVEDLAAEMTDKGVRLRWKPAIAGSTAPETSVRLRRVEVNLAPATEAMREGIAAFPATSPGKELLANDESGQAFDGDFRKGATYEYTAQRVVRLAVGGQILEMAGPFSRAVRVNTTSEPPE
jgi:hypothetical protein